MYFYLNQGKNIEDSPFYFLKISNQAVLNDEMQVLKILKFRKKILGILESDTNLFLKYWNLSETHDIDRRYQELINEGWDKEKIISFYKELIQEFYNLLNLEEDDYSLLEALIFSTYTSKYILNYPSNDVLIDDIVEIVYAFNSVQTSFKLQQFNDYSHLLIVDILANLYLCYNKLK